MTAETPEARASATTPGSADAPQHPTPTDRNPFLVGLTVLVFVLLAVALILYLTAVGQSDSGAARLVGAANSWLTFAGYTFLAAMIIGGITWHSTHRSK